MKPISLLALALVILFVVSPQSIAQSSSRRLPSPGSRNRNIANIVREIDAKNIERTIRQLVAFGTRNTLSEQNDPKRGIGAARDWLYAEFLKAAETSGGRMTVEKQSFEQPKAQRVPQPTILTNIVATLKGTQPESADRVYVVSGHYDSMCTSPTDAKCDAPGANDDASGTAAVLEMARVMAKYQFDATIVFILRGTGAEMWRVRTRGGASRSPMRPSAASHVSISLNVVHRWNGQPASMQIRSSDRFANTMSE